MNTSKQLIVSNSPKIISGGDKFDFVYMLKFVAILLITNSHFKPVYSGTFSQLAFGGAMGCSIFFFVSGFTLAKSKKDNFLRWYGKRILRIYPAMWIYYLVTFKFENWLWFIWPHLWFLQAIMVFYAIFYFVGKYASDRYITIAATLVFPLLWVYTISDHSEWMMDYAQHPYKIHWIYYFSIMLVGAWCRINMDKIPINLSHLNKYLLLSACLISFMITYGLKYVCEKNLLDMNCQLFFPILLLFSVFAFFFTSMAMNLSAGWFSKVVVWIADRTLELFIVQVLIIKEFSVIGNPAIRLIVVVLTIFISAGVLHWITNLLINPVLKKYF